MPAPHFVDIHCHLLPGIDDGPPSWDQSLAMARLAARDGVQTVIATPHQLGAFPHNRPDAIRKLAARLQQIVHDRGLSLQILPGADVRIEADLIEQLRRGDLLTLADRGKHVLLELPHELYFPLDRLLDQLQSLNLTAVLSHPERNRGLLRRPEQLEPLVRRGCLLQITAGSLAGAFGQSCQKMARRLLQKDLVHFVATDAHSPRTRRPQMRRAFDQIAQLAGPEKAFTLCCAHPAAVARGQDLPNESTRPPRQRSFHPWRRRRAG